MSPRCRTSVSRRRNWRISTPKPRKARSTCGPDRRRTNNPMDRFNAMRIFTRIVELGSFSKAAEDLQMPAATATYTIKQLEARLGVRLLQRTTRHVSTTLDGQAYYQRCVRILADVEETEAGFGNSGAAPRGKLRVDLQGTLALHYVLPRLSEFFARYPQLELDIGMGDRLVDLVRDG